MGILQQRYLHLAWQAVERVERLMSIGAGNRPLDLLTTFGGSYACVVGMRSREAGRGPQPMQEYIARRAAVAELRGCGNCGEQAAIAMVDLARNHRLMPLEYMARTNADHAFVVIGRPRNSSLGDHTTWGENCVICDPWAKDAFISSEIMERAYKPRPFFGVLSYFRVDVPHDPAGIFGSVPSTSSGTTSRW